MNNQANTHDFSYHSLFDVKSFTQALQQSSSPSTVFQQTVQHASLQLERQFTLNTPISKLLRARAWFVDQIIKQTWQYKTQTQQSTFTCIAVGGYGRKELYPHSDIDLLVLLVQQHNDQTENIIGEIITFLWDIGLKVSHSVRTIVQCENDAKTDSTVHTNFLDSRYIIGKKSLFSAFQHRLKDNTLWSPERFFNEKCKEQKSRYLKYNDTAYLLEPNIKNSPGGLRDIHMLFWIAKHAFNASSLNSLVKSFFLDRNEYKALIKGYNALGKIRFALHILSHRCEDRLLLDYQNTLASRFGFSDNNNYLAIEQFMKSYFRTIKELSILNEMLLQSFQEKIIPLNKDMNHIISLNKYFQKKGNALDVKHNNLFVKKPNTLLETFVLLAKMPDITHLSTHTIRLIHSRRHFIDDDFRNDASNKKNFIVLLKQNHGVFNALNNMNKLGILGHYIPQFGRIIGQIQYDLFHIYTVDTHSLFVIRNIEHFLLNTEDNRFSLATLIAQRLEKIYVLFIAALFHDIAKGRGGDHSILGAQDARDFCMNHKLEQCDTDLISWLVNNHLLLSTTAQRKDIQNAQVIDEFASKVGHSERLEYLYVLTVADIYATNQTLWTQWKSSLLEQLFISTLHALSTQPHQATNDLINQKQKQALVQLLTHNHQIKPALISTLWKRFTDDYFTCYSTENIAWQSASILQHNDGNKPLVMIKQHYKVKTAIEIFIYTRQRDNLFSTITSSLDKMRLNIVRAHIIASNDNYTLDMYTVIQHNNMLFEGKQQISDLKHRLTHHLTHAKTSKPRRARPMPRRLKHLHFPTQINIYYDKQQQATALEITASDKPGALALIAKAFMSCNISVNTAMINTLGDRVEDIFYITDKKHRTITNPDALKKIKSCLKEFLE